MRWLTATLLFFTQLQSMEEYPITINPLFWKQELYNYGIFLKYTAPLTAIGYYGLGCKMALPIATAISLYRLVITGSDVLSDLTLPESSIYTAHGFCSATALIHFIKQVQADNPSSQSKWFSYWRSSKLPPLVATLKQQQKLLTQSLTVIKMAQPGQQLYTWLWNQGLPQELVEMICDHIVCDASKAYSTADAIPVTNKKLKDLFQFLGKFSECRLFREPSHPRYHSAAITINNKRYIHPITTTYAILEYPWHMR